MVSLAGHEAFDGVRPLSWLLHLESQILAQFPQKVGENIYSNLESQILAQVLQKVGENIYSNLKSQILAQVPQKMGEIFTLT